jgi:hypothetical protein
MTTTARTTQWTAERALALSREEFIQLFKTLPAPEFEGFAGEFTGYAHLGDTEESRQRVTAVMYDENSERGYWLGKAYKPETQDRGEGYNRWRRPGGRVERNLRFGTHMGASHIDGRPALIMTYGSFSNRAGANDLIDEIRRLDEGLYLGLGTSRAEDGGRTPPGPFVLVGPIGPWVGVDDERAEAK